MQLPHLAVGLNQWSGTNHLSFLDLERNARGVSLVTLLAVKVLVMNFLHGGSLTPIRWV